MIRIFLIFVFLFSFSYADDAAIEVVKKVENLPGIGIEDASVSYDDGFRKSFFKSLLGDLNVLALYSVDSHPYKNVFDANDVVLENKSKDYVVRYRIFEDSDNIFDVSFKLFKKSTVVLSKNYRIKNKNLFVFVAHAMAYDINEYMGGAPVEWMKKKVLVSRLVSPRQSEILVCDYTMTFSQRIVSGGLNTYPKWANKEQTGFYYTSLNGFKPSLKFVDIKSGSSSTILSSDGMIICSDVSEDGKKLLVTMAPDGQPDIYMYSVGTKEKTRLTTFGGIDVNGQFMKNNKVAFISNRLGYPNVFSLTIGSNAVQQVVYYGKNNSSCAAHNEYVVYKARESADNFGSNTFNLHLISTENGFVKRLTANGVNEYPRFSKDGEAVLYVKELNGEESIGIVRLKYNKNYLFPLHFGKIQSIDW
jgi:TolB protein